MTKKNQAVDLGFTPSREALIRRGPNTGQPEAFFHFGSEVASRRFAMKAIDKSSEWAIRRVEWDFKDRSVKVYCDGSCPLPMAQTAFKLGGTVK